MDVLAALFIGLWITVLFTIIFLFSISVFASYIGNPRLYVGKLNGLTFLATWAVITLGLMRWM